MHPPLRLQQPKTVLLIVFFCLLAACCAQSIASADTWWHLATGRWIVFHRTIPHADPFSFTSAGKPWVAHEALSEVLLYEVHLLGGFPLLALFNTALLAGAFTLVWLRCEGPAWLTCTAVLLGAMAAQPGFAIRPQSFTLLLAAAFLLLAKRYLRGGQSWLLLIFPALTLLWVQLHAGFLLGVFLLFAFSAAGALDHLAGRGGSAYKRCAMLAASGAACLLVAPLNPNGAAILRYPVDVMRMKANAMIVEWQPPALALPRYWPFLTLAGLTFLALLLSRKLYRPGQWLLFCGMLAAALHSARNIPIFTLIAVPLLVEHAPKEWAAFQLKRVAPKAQTALAWTLLVLALPYSVYKVHRAIEFQERAGNELFPAQAVAYLQNHGYAGNLLNDYAFGGYLLWREIPVYVDGRADLYGDRFLSDYYEMYQGHIDPEPFLQRYRINTVLLLPGSPLGGLFEMKMGNHSWLRPYQDGHSVIYVRTNPLPQEPR